MGDIINGHVFSTISSASSCKKKCGWTWTENGEWDGKIWKIDPAYSFDFGGPFYETPPICPYGSYDTEEVTVHIVNGKEWKWPKGEYTDPIEDADMDVYP